MDTVIDNDLLEKIAVIVQGPNSNALKQFVDYLYDQEEEYFSPEDLAAIEAGFEQIRRGEYITLEELKRKHGL
jgi:predicted transcriptional regulator